MRLVSLPNAKHAVDVVPDTPLEDRGFTALPLGHGTALQTIHHPKLLIQEMPDVRIEPVDQREAMVFPRVILLNTARGFCNCKKDPRAFPKGRAGELRTLQNSIGFALGVALPQATPSLMRQLLNYFDPCLCAGDVTAHRSHLPLPNPGEAGHFFRAELPHLGILQKQLRQIQAAWAPLRLLAPHQEQRGEVAAWAAAHQESRNLTWTLNTCV